MQRRATRRARTTESEPRAASLFSSPNREHVAWDTWRASFFLMFSLRYPPSSRRAASLSICILVLMLSSSEVCVMLIRIMRDVKSTPSR